MGWLPYKVWLILGARKSALPFPSLTGDEGSVGSMCVALSKIGTSLMKK